MLSLSFQLLKLYAEGVLPATAVQTLAGAAFADGWGHDDPVATKLSQLGSSGRYPANCLRDLVLRAPKQIPMRGPGWFREVPGACWRNLSRASAPDSTSYVYVYVWRAEGLPNAHVHAVGGVRDRPSKLIPQVCTGTFPKAPRATHMYL